MSAAFQHVVTLLSFVLALGVSHQLVTVVQIARAVPPSLAGTFESLEFSPATKWKEELHVLPRDLAVHAGAEES
jgi:hypothetical protein